METKARFDKRDGELRVLLALARHVARTDDLHFGYWDNGLAVQLCNLPLAQERHSQLILDRIPKAVRTVLDVGCGAGRMAARLLARGYEVEGVTPSALLAAEARKLLGGGFRIHECRFEELNIDQRYDLVLFSESFHYMQMEAGLDKSVRCTREGGHILICDIFRRDAQGDSPLNGGPQLARFRELTSAQPLQLCEDLDITHETAPTLDLADDILTKVICPTWEIFLERLQTKQPVLFWFCRHLLRRKIERFEWRYLRGAFSASNFERYKSYRLMLFRRTSGHPA